MLIKSVKLFTTIMVTAAIVVVLLSSPSFAANSSKDNSSTTGAICNKALIAEVPSVKKFLQTAAQPMGKTMYVYGGGWLNSGASKSARTLGISETWVNFYKNQTKDYNYNKYRYRTELGLDCTGFVGWSIYNTLEKKNGKKGYVYKSTVLVDRLQSRGLGTKIGMKHVKKYQPGDILSSPIEGHAFISLGQCSDGSLLILHSRTPGVSVAGTPTMDNNMNSEAILLAKDFMQENYPAWYNRFPQSVIAKKVYLTQFDILRWKIGNNGVLQDKECVSNMTPEEVLEILSSDK